MEEQNKKKCHEILERIIYIFSEESKRYFKSIVDIGSFQVLLEGMAMVMIREKTGANFIKDLVKIIVKKDKGKVGREAVFVRRRKD